MRQKDLPGGDVPPRRDADGRPLPEFYRYDDLRRHEEPMMATNPSPSSAAARALDDHSGTVPDRGCNQPNPVLTPDQAMNQDQQSRTNEDLKADRE